MNYTTITEMLRKLIVGKYYDLKEMFYNNTGENFEEDIYDVDDFEDNNDFQDEEFDENIDDFIEEQGNNFRNEVYDNLIDDIRNRKYKKLMYLIILKDNFEYLKSRKIKYTYLGCYEDELLINLESIEPDKFSELLDADNELFLDALTIFLEYNILYDIDSKHELRKLLKYKKVSLKKFKINLLDDMEYQLNKKRNK